MNRAALAFTLQLVVSLVLLGLLAWRVPYHEAMDALKRLRPGTLVSCVALALVGYLGRARRWSYLLERCGVSLPARTSYRLTLVGTFYGLVTPGRVGEFARILHLDAPRTATLSSAVWDRVADILILELLCVPAFVLVPAWRGTLLLSFLVLVAFTIAGVVALGNPAVLRGVARIVPALERPAERWAKYSRNLLLGGVGLASFGWGAFFYVFTYAVAWLLIHDLVPHASPLLLVGLPVIPLLGNLPVALGGLGLREHVSASVFGQFGAGAATGAVFSLLLFTTVTLVPGFLGFLVSALPRVRGNPVETTRS